MKFGLARSRGHRQLRRGSQIPYEAASEHEADCNELRSAQGTSKHGTTAGVVAKEFKEEARDAIEEKVCPKNLAVELFALEHPGKKEEDSQLNCGFKQLRRFESVAQGGSHKLLRQRIGKCDTPEVVRRFAVTAPCREAAESSDRMTHGEAGRECVAGGERRHVMLAQKPGRNDECPNQSAAEHSSSLQSGQTEDFPGMLNVEMPVNQNVKQFRAYDPCQHDRDTKIPRILRLNSLLRRVADADPKADQNT